MRLNTLTGNYESITKVDNNNRDNKTPTGFIAKFVVSRCTFTNFEWVFCFVNHLSGGGVNANHDATHSPSLALKTAQDCSRTAKEIAMMSRLFVEGRGQTLLYSCERQE